MENVTVLLIEAGGPDSNSDIHIPLAYAKLQMSDVDWKYKTSPQKQACLNMYSHQCAWPRGKVLGGTSGINAMVYTRGNKADYEPAGRRCMEQKAGAGTMFFLILSNLKTFEQQEMKDTMEPMGH